MTKIYVVIVEDKATGDKWADCDFVCDNDPYEAVRQEVFFDKEQAQRVFYDVNKHGTTYAVSLQEFEV